MRTTIVFATAILVSGFAYAGEKGTTADKIKMLDADADGQVSAAEFTAKGKTQADFEMIDTNKDGFATAAELDAHKSMKKDDSRQMDKPKTDDMSSSDGG
jgi:hypothetical protein